MPLSTFMGSSATPWGHRPDRSMLAVTSPLPGSILTIRSVSHTFAQTRPSIHSSSFSRFTGRPFSVTDSEWLMRPSTGFMKCSLSVPSLRISRSPSWVSP